MEEILNNILEEIKDMKVEMKDMRSEIIGINKRMDSMESDISSIKETQASMESDISSIKQRQAGMESDISSIKSIQESMLITQESMKSQIEENTNILKALLHSSEVHKAGLDNLEIQVAKIRGDIKEIRSDINFLDMNTAKNRLDIAKMKKID